MVSFLHLHDKSDVLINYGIWKTSKSYTLPVDMYTE